jgi:hypothetical protein
MGGLHGDGQAGTILRLSPGRENHSFCARLWLHKMVKKHNNDEIKETINQQGGKKTFICSK